MLAKQLIVEDCLNDCKERVPQTVVLSDNELIKPERLAQQFLVPFAVKRDIDLVLWKRTFAPLLGRYCRYGLQLKVSFTNREKCQVTAEFASEVFRQVRQHSLLE